MEFGVITLPLPRHLPHVILDAKSNNTFNGRMSNLALFESGQKFDLEGDFGKYFNVYAPSSYRPDTLYFLTPELMVQLIDNSKDFDIEVVDDQLYFYGSKFSFSEPEMRRVFNIIDALGEEFHENTDLYADTRIDNKNANVIAPPGQRLNQSTWLLVVFFVLVFIYVFFFISKIIAEASG